MFMVYFSSPNHALSKLPIILSPNHHCCENFSFFLSIVVRATKFLLGKIYPVEGILSWADLYRMKARDYADIQTDGCLFEDL